jgi:ribosomal protein L20
MLIRKPIRIFVVVVMFGEMYCENCTKEMNEMRLRKQALGNRNLVGARVEMARKNQGMKQKELLAQLQVNGVDMNASGLSKLEGQIRYVTDFELSALANILNVSVDWLLGREE